MPPSDAETNAPLAFLADDEDAQESLTFIQEEYTRLTGWLRPPAKVGRQLRDWALEWIEMAQGTYGHALVWERLLHARVQAERAGATPEQRTTLERVALAAAWQERYAGDLAFRSERLHRELAALATLKAPQRHALMQLMADMQGAIDAAVAGAAAAWADLAPASRPSSDEFTDPLTTIDDGRTRPAGVPRGIVLTENDPTMPPDPHRQRPVLQWGDAPLAALLMPPGTKRHLTTGSYETLCGRTLSPPYQVVKTLGRSGCKLCRRQAAQRFLLCVACGQPRLTEGHPGYCARCSGVRRQLPRQTLSPLGQLDRFLEEERGEW